MTNTPVTSIDEVQDIESVNMYRERLAAGAKPADLITAINRKGRDNARTPMQWSNQAGAGFTTGTPWLHLNSNYHSINAAYAMAADDSVFKTYQKLVKLRHDKPILTKGVFTPIHDVPAAVMAYYRVYQDEKWLVVANLSDKPQTITLTDHVKQVVIANYQHRSFADSKVQLAPYEAFVVAVTK